MENTIIGPFAALTFLRLMHMKKYKECLLRNFGVYVVMALLAVLALIHVALCVIVNALALFWIAYFLIDEFSPNNYFPAGMALIFFQISAVDIHAPEGLIRRLSGLTMAFVIVFLFLFVREVVEKKRCQEDRFEVLVKKGLALCEQLQKTGRENEIKTIQEELCRVNRQLCREIYEENRSAIVKKVPDNKYCTFVALFQTAGYVAGKEDYERLKLLMNSCQNILNSIPEEAEQRIRIRTNRWDIRSFRLRFALRQVCVLTPCLVFAYMSGWSNSYWLAISVFFMMIPLYERTPGRIAQRMAGTLAGLLICIVLFAVFQSLPSRIVIMTIFNFLIYCSGSYATMVTCITCSALALNFSQDNYLIMLLQRLIYTAAGALIAWIANTWIFPIKAKKQMNFIGEILNELRHDLNHIAQLPRPERICRMNRLIVMSYMLSSRMQDLNQALPEAQQNVELQEALKMHMRELAGYISQSICISQPSL